MNRRRGEDVVREVGKVKLIGQSPAIQRVIEDIAIFAPVDATVILYGETGVGKDVVPD
jgi:transcriptional regulator with GAF, ATPase, and Fis domain